MRMQQEIVCEHCLTSVEIASSSLLTGQPRCPACGSFVLMANSAFDGPTRDLSPVDVDRTDETPSVQAKLITTMDVEQIGDFKIIRLLGDGGYGQVFLAHDQRMDRLVALKVLKPRKLDEKSIRRFFQEARLAAALDHPNIVPVWNFGRDDDRSWISYRLIQGKNLCERLADGSMTPIEAVNITIKLASALQHAHDKSIVHRDVKPSNIIIDEHGEPYLTDFGLARRIEFESILTIQGSILGSTNYMAPEQALGRAHKADARSDIYSLGIVFYEMLCGRVPIDYTHSDKREPTQKLIKPCPPVRAHDPSIPKELERICLRALKFEPIERYQQAGELMNDLIAWRDFEAGRKPRRPPIVTQGLVAAGLTAAFFGGLYWKAHQEPAAVDLPALSSLSVPRSNNRQGTGTGADHQTVVAKAAPPSSEIVAAYVGNISSRTVHLPTCKSLSVMKEVNRREFAQLTDAIEHGFKGCEKCRP